MPTGNTPRVQRLVRAYTIVYGEEHMPLGEHRASAQRVAALRLRIAAVLPLLSRVEAEAYYAHVKRIREATR